MLFYLDERSRINDERRQNEDFLEKYFLFQQIYSIESI